MAKEFARSSTLIRLAISVEGPTELEFVKNVLAINLREKGVEAQAFSINGNVTVDRLARDMANHYWDFDRVTSLVDFYGFHDKNTATPDELERLIHNAVNARIGRSWDESTVFPYVQVYEFEGLLFSEVSAFGEVMMLADGCVEELERIRARFSTPEDINDSKETAPSKRILKVIPRYNKHVNGYMVAQAAGLDKIRAECPRFKNWLTSLDSLACS